MSSRVEVMEHIKKLECDIDVLYETSNEIQNEINYFRKEVITQINRKFDQLIQISNSKINQQKENIISQINEIQLHQSSLSQHIMNNKSIVTASVNINFNKKKKK
eukprot:449936_1